MRSFALALIAATFATLSSTTPVSLPANVSVNGISAPGAPKLPSTPVARTDSSTGQISSTEEQIKSLIQGAHRRTDGSELNNGVKAVESEVGRRDSTPSIDGILAGLPNEIQPLANKLFCLDSTNLTVSVVAEIVASIKTPLLNAVSDLGANVTVDLDADQVAALVSADVNLVLTAVDHVLGVSVDPDAAAQVKAELCDLGETVTTVVDAVVSLVDGLVTVLAPLLASVEPIITALGLDDLTDLLGL